MDVLNFIEKLNFPLASTWLDKQYQITKQLSDSIAKMVMQQLRATNAQAVIYSGCTVNNNVVSTGYIVFNGVLYQLKESNVAAYLVLRKQATTVQVGVDTYTPYENWWLELSDGNTGDDVVGSVPWADILRYGVERLSGTWELITDDSIGASSIRWQKIGSRVFIQGRMQFDEAKVGFKFSGLPIAPKYDTSFVAEVMEHSNNDRFATCTGYISTDGTLTLRSMTVDWVNYLYINTSYEA